jgi:DNA-binding NtrC family response regulator
VAVSRIIELIESGRQGEPRQVRLKGRAGPDLSAALGFIAREARVRGFVPVSTACVSREDRDDAGLAFEDLVRLVRGHHVLVIHRHTGAAHDAMGQAMRLVLELSVASSRPHLLLTVDAADAATEHELCLYAPSLTYRHPADALRTDCTGVGVQSRAPCACPSVARAREPQSDYLVPSRSRSTEDGRVDLGLEANAPRRGWPAHEDATGSGVAHARARSRSVDGIRLAKQGRHAAGERLLREAAGALARRGDDVWAGRATLDLGRVLHWRGRARDAGAAFEQARKYFDRCGWSAASIRATVYLGLVWTDNGRLPEAEAALRAAAIAAEQGRSNQALEFARLGLARCLVWQRRWDEALFALGEPGSTGADQGSPEEEVARDGGPARARGRTEHHEGQCREPAAAWRWDEDVDAGVMTACLESRIAVGRGDLSTAGLCATRAGARARRSAEARDLATARTAAARVHAEIADVEGLRHQVREGLRAAARAHAPLEALRLRLTLVDGLRRAGCCHEADRLAARLRRVRAGSLPLVLQRRVDAVVGGRYSTDISALPVTSPPRGAGIAARAVTPAGAFQVSNGHATLVTDIVDLLQICHDVADDAAMLERIATHLRQRARASSVALFGAEASGLVPLAWSGSRPLPLETASRACDASLHISPDDSADRFEDAVPVRYGGATIGALACRWPIDARPCADRLEAILATAATLAAPAVRTALDRRASPQTVLAAEPDLMGLGDLMTRLREAIARAAATPFPVLIEGESGSGKELVARAIHRLSPRRDRKYCPLNCAALTDELLEAELFGHARGAFTGAVGERAGLFEDADGGTLILDEVGELSARAQAKLLRTLQQGEVRRVGENVTRSVDVRIVASTNRPLQDDVAAGRFRRDLFYRLAVIRVAVPPLRDRVDDIPALANHFWAHAVARTGSRATLAPATVAALARYHWPGNVRELQNVMTALAVSAPRRGSVGPGSLPSAIAASGVTSCRTTLGEARRAFEVRYVRAAFAQAGGNRGRAARDLGLSRQGFAKVLARLGVDGAGSLRDGLGSREA